MSRRPKTAGLLLAAGAGRRMGGPKALRDNGDGQSWAAAAARDLAWGGCDPVIVVVGASASEVAAGLPATLPAQGGGAVPVEAVVAPDWAEGMGASLRAGLAHLARSSGPLPSRPGDGAVVAALVALVDTPGIGPAVTARLTALAGPDVLVRAGYQGRPGHPVLLGRSHWDGVVAVANGDTGAREYLAARAVTVVECGGIGDDRDLDEPADLEQPWVRRRVPPTAK